MSESRIDFVIQKYRLFELTFIDAEEKGKKLGHGKLMDDETLKKFIEGDPSGNHKYLDWMLFMAGGGQEAMEKSLNLWDGDSMGDPNSLKNQCRQDFIDEWTNGHTDEQGIYHKPIPRPQAEQEWVKWEARSKFEFVMGDQDVSMEDGYGFYRHWPGKNNLYPQIVNAVKLWHIAQPKLQAQNKRYELFRSIKNAPHAKLTPEQQKFVERFEADPVKFLVELDIYAGWRPREYSQEKATYKTMGDLLRTLADVRKMQILRDIRYETIYEDDVVSAVCPLTVGASIKLGIGKWCVCNKTDFDRSFDPKQAGQQPHWQNYCGRGPLVYLSFKVPMPPYLHKVAAHLQTASIKRLNAPWDSGINWVDCENHTNGGVNYEVITARLREEHVRTGVGSRRQKDDAPVLVAAVTSASDEAYYMWGGRKPSKAWTDPAKAEEIVAHLELAMTATAAWARTFDASKLVLDYLSDVSAEIE